MPALHLLPRSREARLPLAVLLGWIAFVCATQHWRPWEDGIRLEYATDVVAFERIARAAPGLPEVAIQTPHADRFAAHWLVGGIADLTSLDLRALYAVATALCLLAAALSVHASLRALRLGLPAYAIAVGTFVASAYPIRYLLAAPGMLTDTIFVLGLALAVFGLVTRRFGWVLGGLAVATVGRQTALPAALVVAAVMLSDPRWRERRVLYAALALAVPAALYATAHQLASSFADTSGRGIVEMSLLGGEWTASDFLVHLGRAAIVVVLPLGVLLAAWARTRARPPLALLALGLVVWAQAVALAPDWTHAEPRLAGLALPALAVTLGAALKPVPLGRAQTAAACLGVALASLHHLYTDLGLATTAGWGAAVAAGALLVAGATALGLHGVGAVSAAGSGRR